MKERSDKDKSVRDQRHFNRGRFVEYCRMLARMKVPFRHQGQSIKTGVDCINLPRLAYKAQGLSLPEELEREFDHYHERPDGARLLAILRKWFIERKPEWEAAGEGDLIILYARRNPQHLAVKVSEDFVVEAYRSEDRKTGEIIERPLDPRRRIAAVFRIPDFEQAS